MKEKLEMLISVMNGLLAGSGAEVPSLVASGAGEEELSRMAGELKARFPAEWVFALEKVRGAYGCGSVSGDLRFADIGKALGEGKKVTVLMRHAERPPLDPSDTSFGESLPITEYGKETSVAFGRMLAEAAGSVRPCVFCSRTFRTIQTACGVLEGFGLPGLPVVDELLGGATPFFGPLAERMELIAEGRYLERLNEYYASGVQRGYMPLAPATDAFEDRLCRFHRGGGGLAVAVTHDINVASFLAGRGAVKSFTAESWPRYLDAAVITEDVLGCREYSAMRWAPLP